MYFCLGQLRVVLVVKCFLHCCKAEASYVCRYEQFEVVNEILLPHGFSSLSNEVLLRFILYGDERLTIDTI